ncbi:MAG: hypothetical protein AAGG81_07290, partial [Chlamydiota bacterium]
ESCKTLERWTIEAKEDKKVSTSKHIYNQVVEVADKKYNDENYKSTFTPKNKEASIYDDNAINIVNF